MENNKVNTSDRIYELKNIVSQLHSVAFVMADSVPSSPSAMNKSALGDVFYLFSEQLECVKDTLSEIGDELGFKGE